MAQMKRQTTRRQHGAGQFEVYYKAAELFSRSVDILLGEQSHRVKPLVDFVIAFGDIIVKCAADPRGISAC